MDEFSDNTETYELIKNSIELQTPALVGEGKTIKPGFSKTLDSLKTESSKAKIKMANIESREKEKTGIKSLKIGYNRVFGYYIEVSRPNLDHVPDDYIRRQTLVGGERFITPEMKEYESQILNAQDRLNELENSLFRQVCGQVGDRSQLILATANALAQVDVFCSLADIASRYGYTRPELNDGDVIEIKQGRHPVVERMLPPGAFVSNDTSLSSSNAQLALITGPNMAGKSTYIRPVSYTHLTLPTILLV